MSPETKNHKLETEKTEENPPDAPSDAPPTGRQRKITRRAALKVLVAMPTIVAIGCVTPRFQRLDMGLSNEEIHEGLKQFHNDVEDPHGYLEHLREREFIIPNKIFDAYVSTVDDRPPREIVGVAVAEYIHRSHINTRGRRGRLRNNLEELNLNTAEIDFYKSLLSSSDLIIFRESILRSRDFLKLLPHERFHKALRALSAEEYRMMRDVAEEIVNRRNEDGGLFIRERQYPGKIAVGFLIDEVMKNWEEFYTYLAQGEFEDFVEEALKNEYPEAYGISFRIREKCGLESE